MQGVLVSEASTIISKEWEKVKASEKKMKKYIDLYEEEKQRHEEALQRYQEDQMDEMEIINLYKKYIKTKAVSNTNQKPPEEYPARLSEYNDRVRRM